ncbi:MAG TPA: SLBB domain-containing protein [Candidatus Kapabacteria bacterium]|nr:SLBB domain-containing protein [Candidatus Kapabacteria bacterium]
MSMIKKYSLFLFVSILVTGAARAQLTSPATIGTPTVPTLSSALPDKNTPTISPDAIIFDAAVNANEYRLGPGDILQYRSWTSNEAQQLMISADEVLAVPRYGAFSTKGKTLAEIQREVMIRVEKEFKHPAPSESGLFSLTLSQPRRIMVNVLGQVESPGVYVYSGATRAALAVEAANKPVSRASLLNDQAFELEQEKRKREADRLRPYIGDAQDKTASMRKIIVTHGDGTTERVDLLRFNATHDPRFSPMLREGDVVYVPYKKTLEGQVGVYGAVNSPGDYEFVQGDSLWALIRGCYGPTEGADLSKVELVRMNSSGTSSVTEIKDCNAIRLGAAPDVPLEAGDRIFVRGTADERELSRVIIKGEVNFPGVYPINRIGTKLSDVIKLAGGFTPNAFLAGGTVIRKKIDIDNKDITADDEAKLVGRIANLTVEDTANFHFLTQVRNPYVAVDMERLFEKGDANADIVLRDGDVISIPVTPNSVYVWGYVGNTGYIPFQPGASATDYIAMAGGYAEGGVKEGTRVIKARTRQWVKPNGTVIEPGDEVYVPQERLYPSGYDLQKTATIVGIVGAVVGTIATVVTLIVVLKRP